MPLTRFDVMSRRPYSEGQLSRAYTRVDGIAHYAVDPDNAANAGVVDLSLAPRDDDGLVRFFGDLTFLVPADSTRGNGGLLLEVPNRGHQTATRLFNGATFDMTASEVIEPGDGFLFRHGWSVAIVGWQWDVPHPSPRFGLRAPQVPARARHAGEQMQLRIQPSRDSASFALTDQHVGSPGTHAPIAADIGAPASLWRRAHLHAEPEPVDAAAWAFARDEAGRPVPDATHVWLDGGFKAGTIYDVVYRPVDCPVVGAGLLAIRDAALFARDDAASPTHGLARHVIGEGISQCGRFLRTLIHLGLNRGENGAQAFDGLLVHIAGGRRGEFNQRHGQPSVQPTPSFGHRFPFADAPQTDARTGESAGLHDRLGAAMPKIFYTDTASEYWRGDASLAHTDANSGADVALPASVRRYLFAATQHGPGAPPFSTESARGDRGANFNNVLDYVPLYRAALTNLLAWIADDTTPPDSVYPRVADGSARPRADVLEKLAAIPGLHLPAPERLASLRPVALGPLAELGIASDLPARVDGEAYPCVVSDVDDDGNETAGVRLPDLDVPVATHTGFNPRLPASGGAGQLLEYIGSTLPFARDAAARQAAGDPRLSLAERFAGRDAYLAAVRKASAELVKRRLLLDEDVEACVGRAAVRYDAVAGG